MVKRVLSVIALILFVATVIYVGMVVHWVNNATIKTNKQYSSVYIDETDKADYKVFLNPDGKYRALNQIDVTIRDQIAYYMKSNHLKLEVGKQEFNIFDGDLEEYLYEDFRFEKMSD